MNLISRELVLKGDLGVHGNLFGGKMLSFLDKAGAIEATRLCQSSKMVTVEMEKVRFLRSVKENQQVWIYGNVESVGNTSIVISLEARRHCIYTAGEKLVCSTKVVFVRVDDEGNKRPLGTGARMEIEKIIKENKENAKN